MVEQVSVVHEVHATFCIKKPDMALEFLAIRKGQPQPFHDLPFTTRQFIGVIL
jgi:hypothetical protein